MEDINLILEQLRNTNSAKKNSAVQGVELTEPAPGQLHISKEQIASPESVEIHDFFFLVIKVSEKSCNVIPGSWDGIMAGPQDIVLPQDVLGQYVYLSPGMQTTVPREALANGFAILDNETYQRVLVSLTKTSDNGKGKEESPRPFSGAMPYISDFDDRIEYHKTQQELLEKLELKKQVSKIPFQRLLEFRHWGKVAGIAIICTVFFVLLMNSDAPTPKETSLPTGARTIPAAPAYGWVTRGISNEFVVYSPNMSTYSTRPLIIIGGDEKKEYLVSVFDVEDNLIAEKRLPGNSTTNWDEFSKIELNDGDAYMLQIKEENKIILAGHAFWLLEQDEREQLTAQLQGKSETQRAECLSEAGCYAEALFLINGLLRKDENMPTKNLEENKKLLQLKDQCLKNLNIKDISQPRLNLDDLKKIRLPRSPHDPAQSDPPPPQAL